MDRFVTHSVMDRHTLATKLNYDAAELSRFCRAKGIRRLDFFGSILSEDFNLDSEVDLLVEFEPTLKIGYLDLSALERQFSTMLGRKVDLRTPNELSRYFREDVQQSAVSACDP